MKPPRRGSTESFRRETPTLTFIPEGERTIDHRLQVIFVGRGARVLAQRIVESDLNLNYHPRSPGRTPIAAQDAMMLRKQGSMSSARSRGSSPGDTQVGSIVSSNTIGTSVSAGDEQLVLFCPMCALSSSLVRVRFAIVEGFSASMPMLLDEAVARNTCVALLHWRDSAAGGNPGLGSAGVAATVKEFHMRVAEMTYSMDYLPLIFLLSINEAAEASTELMQVVQERRLKDGRTPQLVEVEDDSVESLLEAIQCLSNTMVKEHDRPIFAASVKTEMPAKSCCCVLS